MKFEILLSTMFQTDLGFLDQIFCNNTINDYNILIINQTTESKILQSNVTNIRVINSFKRGTAASRNLALNNAKGDICLIADDDIIYEKDFDKTILNEFKNYPDAYLLSFEASNLNKIPHQNYPKPQLHNKKSLKRIHNIVMSFKLNDVKKNNIYYNEYFSLGGKFGNGEEYLFLRNALSKRLKAYHVNKNIVIHESYSSGKNMGSDSIIHMKGAQKNHFHNDLYAYAWVFKYVFFLIRKKYITVNQLYSKIK